MVPEVHPDEVVGLGRQMRRLAKTQVEIDRGLGQFVRWHRWLYDAARSHQHMPGLQDFTPAIDYLVALQELVDELLREEMRLAQRYSTWAAIGKAMNLSRQGAQQRARPRQRPKPIRGLPLDAFDFALYRLGNLGRPGREYIAALRRSEGGWTESGWARNSPEVAAGVGALGRQRAQEFENGAPLSDYEARRRQKRKTRALRAQERRAEERRLRAEADRRLLAPPAPVR